MYIDKYGPVTWLLVRVLSPDCRVCSRRLEGRLRWQLSPLQLVELLSEHFESNDEVGVGGVFFFPS